MGIDERIQKLEQALQAKIHDQDDLLVRVENLGIEITNLDQEIVNLRLSKYDEDGGQLRKGMELLVDGRIGNIIDCAGDGTVDVIGYAGEDIRVSVGRAQGMRLDYLKSIGEA